MWALRHLSHRAFWAARIRSSAAAERRRFCLPPPVAFNADRAFSMEFNLALSRARSRSSSRRADPRLGMAEDFIPKDEFGQKFFAQGEPGAKVDSLQKPQARTADYSCHPCSPRLTGQPEASGGYNVTGIDPGSYASRRGTGPNCKAKSDAEARTE